MSPPPPQIFDRAARRLRRDRIARGAPSPLEQGIADELVARLDVIKRRLSSALVINSGTGIIASALRARGLEVTETDHGPVYAAARAGIRCEEDRLDVGAGRFDLVVMPCGLDTVDDVPGALIAARRALADGGLFLGSLIGSPSLPILRDIIGIADATQGNGIARLHPQIDVRGAGDLLVRAGFALPVADAETLKLSYGTFEGLVGDVRATGLSNVLAQRHPVSRRWHVEAVAAFNKLAGLTGRITETVTLTILTGWTPESLR